MSLPEWNFYLADSETMTDIADITQLSSGRRMSFGLNKPGSLNLKMKAYEEISDELVPVSRYVRAERNGTTVWSGPIWQINDELPADDTNVSCVGWFELLNRRFTSERLVYTSQNAGTIAHSLLSHTNSLNAYSNTGITAGANTSSQTRTITYERNTPIGSSIDELSQVENGFDYYVDPVTRTLEITQKRQTVRDDVAFGFNTGADNVLAVSRSIDASQMQNRVLAIGKYSSYVADDTGSQDTYGVFQSVSSLTDVSNDTILQAFASAELTVNRYPRQLWTFTPAPLSANSMSSFVPFDHFDIGDVVKLSVDRGRVQCADQSVRVFAFDIEVDDDGNEKIGQLQTTSNT
jgi:hypothetical protein